MITPSRPKKFTAKSLSASSKAYLNRQAADPFVHRAQAQGYRARAVYKLQHIQDKHKILKPASHGVGQVIVDLGCAPGSWCQLAAQICGPKSTIVGIDLLPVDPLAGVEIIENDFTTAAGLAAVQAHLPPGRKIDVVLSDMAANTTGHATTDGLRTMGLAELAADFALSHLAPGGSFITKLFMNGEEAKLRDSLRPHFTKVLFEKPAASRAESREIFLVGLGFKG